MGKTYKDRPEKYTPRRKPKEKRFESSKGRQKENLKKETFSEVFMNHYMPNSWLPKILEEDDNQR